MKKNVASQVVGAQMITAADGTAFTGSVTVSVTGDGGTQATGSVGSGACTHEGNGFHTYAPAQSETNYDHVAFTFTGTGAVPHTVQIYTSFPQTGDSFARIGAPTGASISADVAAVKTQTAAIETDTQDIQTKVGTPAGASVSADIAAVKSETATIVADTNELQTDWVDGGRLDLILDARASQASVDTVDGIVDSILLDTGIDGVVVAAGSKTGYSLAAGGAGSGAIAAAELNNIADAVLDRNMATGTDSGSTTVRTPRQALRLLRNARSIAAGTLSVKKEDDSTNSWTAAVTTAAGDPIDSVDPAGP